MSSPKRDEIALSDEPDMFRFWWRWFQKLSRWLSRRNVFEVLLVLGFLAVVRSGVSFFPAFDPKTSGEVFPQPLGNYDSLSYGLRTIALVLNLQTEDALFFVSVALLVLIALLFGILVWKNHEKRLAICVITLIYLGPVGAVLLSNIGRHDILVLSGAVVLGLWGYRLPAALGAALMMLAGNPEQAVVIFTCFLLLLYTQAGYKYRAAVTVAAVLVGVVYVSLWGMTSIYEVDSRLSVLPQFFKESVIAFFSNVPVLLYSALGLGLVFFALALTGMPRRSAVLVFVSTLLIPLAFTAITADQTRVMVALSSAQILALTVWVVPRIQGRFRDPTFGLPALIIIVSLLMPSVVVQYPGVIRSPYGEIVFRLSGERIPVPGSEAK